MPKVVLNVFHLNLNKFKKEISRIYHKHPQNFVGKKKRYIYISKKNIFRNTEWICVKLSYFTVIILWWIWYYFILKISGAGVNREFSSASFGGSCDANVVQVWSFFTIGWLAGALISLDETKSVASTSVSFA